MNETLHRLHLYTGEGKGKTTAAMGLALRALGHGYPVLVAQFLKNGKSGELEALRRIPGAQVCCAAPAPRLPFQMSPQELAQTRQSQNELLRSLPPLVQAQRPRLLVLDELAVALHLELVDESAAWALIDMALAFGEVAVTGRYAPAALAARADYVSVIQARKHPFQSEGLAAREGVEW